MELNAMQRLHELKAWKDRQPASVNAAHVPASVNAAPAAVRPAAPATPARKTNRELLDIARSEKSPGVERDRAAETLRRQLKTLCAATLSRRGDGFTSGELEDLTQDVFLRLLQSSTEADPTAAYIARIAANLLIDKRRHAVRRGQNQALLSLDETVVDGPARDVVDPSENVEESVLTRLNNRALRDAIEKLLKPNEATVVLRRAEGLAHDEIARETGQSCASVRKQYERGIKRLQTYAENGLIAV